MPCNAVPCKEYLRCRKQRRRHQQRQRSQATARTFESTRHIDAVRVLQYGAVWCGTSLDTTQEGALVSLWAAVVGSAGTLAWAGASSLGLVQHLNVSAFVLLVGVWATLQFRPIYRDDPDVARPLERYHFHGHMLTNIFRRARGGGIGGWGVEEWVSVRGGGVARAEVQSKGLAGSRDAQVRQSVLGSACNIHKLWKTHERGTAEGCRFRIPGRGDVRPRMARLDAPSFLSFLGCFARRR